MTQRIVDVLSALAEPSRLEIIRILASGGEHCACELMPRLGISQSRVSRHVAVLKAAGLAVDRRDRQWVRYRLKPDMPGEIKAVLEAVLKAAPAREAERELT